MNYRRYLVVAGTAILVLGLAAPSQAIRRVHGGDIMGRTEVEIGLGVRHHENNNSHVIWNQGDLYSSSEGAVGRIGMSYFANENIAYSMSYTVHDVETDSWTYYNDLEAEETTLVHSLMFGMRYYLPQSRPRSAMRPYLAAGIGPVFGTYSYDEVNDCGCDVYSHTETSTVMGTRLGGGVDFMFGPRVSFGVNAGYNFFEDFDEPIAGRRDYSGSEFGVSFGYLFGR
jgi:outer membrane protein W